MAWLCFLSIFISTYVCAQRPVQKTAVHGAIQPYANQQAEPMQPHQQHLESSLTASIHQPSTATESSLPLPRFVALRGKANLHVGPGQQYPVEWQYTIPSFPMEVLAEFGHWRQVRDFQGTRGWLHKSLLTGKRSALVVNSIQNMMNTPHPQGKIIARLSPGVVGRILQIQGDWCKLSVKFDDNTYKGWVEKRHIWGVYVHETHF